MICTPSGWPPMSSFQEIWRILLPTPSAGTSHTRCAAPAPPLNVNAPSPASCPRCVRRLILITVSCVLDAPRRIARLLQVQRIGREDFVQRYAALAEALLVHILRHC